MLWKTMVVALINISLRPQEMPKPPLIKFFSPRGQPELFFTQNSHRKTVVLNNIIRVNKCLQYQQQTHKFSYIEGNIQHKKLFSYEQYPSRRDYLRGLGASVTSRESLRNSPREKHNFFEFLGVFHTDYKINTE